MAIEYKSTRGEDRVSFEEALLRGLAPDGGLYVPAEIPRLPYVFTGSRDTFKSSRVTLTGSRDTSASSRDASSDPGFVELSLSVLSRWLSDEIDDADLEQVVRDALNFDVTLIPLDGVGWEDVHVLELFHGPTLSFKDFGARTMARLMGHFLERRDEKVTILVATSGDTGSAVADGFAGQDRIDVVLLYPKGKVSRTQERQLIVERPGVRALAVEGDFDDCQRLVKEAFSNPALADRNLSSANSINIGRLLPQMLYYIWAVGTLKSRDVLFCVPSGNLGNLTAGILALLSGLPVRHFIAAHNANDFFPRLLSGEDAGFGPTVRTLSNAMDVGAPSNFERLDALLERDQMRRLIQGASVSDEATSASMRRVYDATGYVADPHTAVGLEAVRRARGEGRAEGPVIVLSTAHPCKFPEIVEVAIGIKPAAPERLSDLWRKPVAVEAIAPSQDALARRL
jgi:threonine synthase